MYSILCSFKQSKLKWIPKGKHMFKHQRGALKHFKNQTIQFNEGFEFTDCNSEVIIRIYYSLQNITVYSNDFIIFWHILHSFWTADLIENSFNILWFFFPFFNFSV